MVDPTIVQLASEHIAYIFDNYPVFYIIGYITMIMFGFGLWLALHLRRPYNKSGVKLYEQ